MCSSRCLKKPHLFRKWKLFRQKICILWTHTCSKPFKDIVSILCSWNTQDFKRKRYSLLVNNSSHTDSNGNTVINLRHHKLQRMFYRSTHAILPFPICFSIFFVSRSHKDHKDTVNRENERQRGTLCCPRSLRTRWQNSHLMSYGLNCCSWRLIMSGSSGI